MLQATTAIIVILGVHANVDIVLCFDFFDRHIGSVAHLWLHETRIDVHVVRIFLRLLAGRARKRHQDWTVVIVARPAAAVHRRSVMRRQRTGQLVDTVERIIAPTSELLEQRLKTPEQIVVSAVSMNMLGVKVLDQLDVAFTWLGGCIGAVLLQDFVHWPLLDLANAGNNTTGTVAALIAVDVHWVILGVKCEQNRIAESAEVGLHLSLLVGLDIKNGTSNAASSHEMVVSLARLCLCDQRARQQSASKKRREDDIIASVRKNVQNRFDAQLGEELDVARLWKSAAEDCIRNHAAVIWCRQ